MEMKKPTSIHEMFSQLDEPFTGESLFDLLPDIVFFIKNISGQYVIVNNTLVERCAVRDKSQLIGRTPAEVFRPPLGQGFEAQDQKVLQSGRPLLAQLELHMYPSRNVGWCLTTGCRCASVMGRSWDWLGCHRTYVCRTLPRKNSSMSQRP